MADTKEKQLEAARTGQPPPEPATTPKKPRRSGRRVVWTIIGLLAGFIVYAYAFETTEVSLDRITDETRQESLFRVLRALGNPDLLTYEATQTNTDLDYLVPCPPGSFAPGPAGDGATFAVDPPCAPPRAEVTVSGSGFVGNTTVRVFFIPPSGVELRLAEVRTDSEGSFSEVVRIPNRPDEQIQTIRVVSRENVGSIFSPVMVETGSGEVVRSPRWSQNAIDTLDKIIETVFLALLATTAGTFIAIPLSFIAARNLMRDVRIPALQVGLAIAALPLGVVVGVFASRGTATLVDGMPQSALMIGAITGLLGWVSVWLMKIAVPAPGAPTNRSVRILSAIGAGFGLLLAGQAVARFAELGGSWFEENAGPFDFLGRFVATNGDVLATVFGVLAALTGAVLAGVMASRFGYIIGRRAPKSLINLFTILSMALAGAVIALGLGQIVAWLYQVANIQSTVVIPAIVGAGIGALIGWIGLRRGQLGAGLGVYYIARTVFNTMRSIEPLVMAIVFVIWVGIGPFAGSLALGLHTVAALAKLYSEQVESINQGPIEAVRATGATRLQTVVYGVVPQIVAPYISFTMYRWDINVRMSTIIGFVGGGGIGFLLQQNISFLDYRAAAAQMLAIAIVVATMDYVSSRLRERFT